MDKKSVNRKDEENSFEINQIYSNIVANITFSIIKSGCKKIAISSPNKGDGKSTISSNIAKGLSVYGNKVLFIDMDFRRPSASKMFSLENDNGLSDFLMNEKIDNTFDIVKKVDDFPNLDIITTGSRVTVPTNLLASDAIGIFLNSLENFYDYVIIDTPPVNVVSDVLYISKCTDGVIIVVSENSTTHPMLKKAIESFELIDVPILGLILNNAKISSSSYKYKSGYYYYCLD